MKVTENANVSPAINPPEIRPTPKHGEELSVNVPVTAKAGKPATVDVDVGLSARFAESKPKIPEGADAHAPFQFPVSVNDGGRDTTNVAGEELPPPGGGEDTTTGNEPGIDNFGSVTLICDGLRNDAV